MDHPTDARRMRGAHAFAHDGSSPVRHILRADGAVSSVYFRSRPYNCVRVIPNRRAAFDLFPSDSDRTSSMVRRSMSDKRGSRRGARTLET
jgi:hypothetical protein